MDGALSRPMKIQLASDAAGAGGVFDTRTLICFTDNIFPNQLTQRAELTEPDVAGYAQVTAVQLGLGYVGPDGRVHLTAPSEEFIATEIVDPVPIIYGAALCVAGEDGAVVYAWRFDAPVTFGAFVGQGFPVGIDWPYGT